MQTAIGGFGSGGKADRKLYSLVPKGVNEVRREKSDKMEEEQEVPGTGTVW